MDKLLLTTYAQDRAQVVLNGDEVVYTIDDYKMVVATVCSFLGDLNRVLDEADEGIEPDIDYLNDICLNLERAKDTLLRIKKQLGLEGGLSAFESDFNLFGAEFRNGRFKIHKGHENSYKKETKTAAEPYIKGFPKNGKPFNYEAMCMATFFCYPFAKEEIKQPVKLKLLDKIKKYIGGAA